MKKIFIPLMLVVMLSITVIPAAAGGNGPGGPGSPTAPVATPQGTAVASQQKSPRGTFTITGTISAIDTANNTVTITVSRGNKLIQPYLGTDVTVVVTLKTVYLYKTTSTATATKIAYADLAVGNPVSVNGTVKDFVWTATRITVGASLSCLP
jgi:hypothetical protein